MRASIDVQMICLSSSVQQAIQIFEYTSIVEYPRQSPQTFETSLDLPRQI